MKALQIVKYENSKKDCLSAETFKTINQPLTDILIETKQQDSIPSIIKCDGAVKDDGSIGLAQYNRYDVSRHHYRKKGKKSWRL